MSHRCTPNGKKRKRHRPMKKRSRDSIIREINKSREKVRRLEG
jgi:hypothetical protein